jgi:ATP-dependent protease ClpP protease subunit
MIRALSRLSLLALALSVSLIPAAGISRAQDAPKPVEVAPKPADKPAADKPATDKPATDKPADAPAAAANNQGGIKLSPEQQKEMIALQMHQAKVNAQMAEIGLMQSKVQLQKSQLDLEMAKRAIIEMSAQDEVNGLYMFCEPVTHQSVNKAMLELNKLSRRSRGAKGEPLPLTIVLDSPGGDVQAGLGLYDHIRDLSKRGHHMTVKVRGMAASMGGIILQAGDERVVGENAHILIHEVNSGVSGKVSEIEEQLAFSKALWVRLVNILARNKKCTMTADQILEKSRKLDWWITAEEAVKLGFADKID